eukprot:333035-Prymnesium_polylepis.1
MYGMGSKLRGAGGARCRDVAGQQQVKTHTERSGATPHGVGGPVCAGIQVAWAQGGVGQGHVSH